MSSTHDVEKILKRKLNAAMSLHRTLNSLSKLEDFLHKNVMLSQIKEDFHGETEELRRLQQENLIVKWALTYVDHHPCAEIREIAEPVRAKIWKCAGVKCDDYKKLHIGQWVRFFNPTNITLVTGGHVIYFAGGRSVTFLDGRGKILIFGPADFASGVKIFTHDHNVEDPEKPSYSQGRVVFPSIVFPDCFIGEDVHVFGDLQLKTVVADFSVTSLKKNYPPYSIVGGIGGTYRLIRHLSFPQIFPPKYLKDLLENAKKSLPEAGEFLNEYFRVIKKYIETEGEREQVWSYLLQDVKRIKEKYRMVEKEESGGNAF
jgi:acetyltransferase-like isoleucine patch superfamily enzyme